MILQWVNMHHFMVVGQEDECTFIMFGDVPMEIRTWFGEDVNEESLATSD